MTQGRDGNSEENIVRTKGLGSGDFVDPVGFIELSRHHYVSLLTVNVSDVSTSTTCAASIESGTPARAIGYEVGEQQRIRTRVEDIQNPKSA